jgi:hypothetical protein
VWSSTGVPRVVTITVSSGTLYADMDGRGLTPLLAKSETEFSGLYGLGVEFTRDGTAPAPELFVKHVSGNYRYTRHKYVLVGQAIRLPASLVISNSGIVTVSIVLGHNGYSEIRPSEGFVI